MRAGHKLDRDFTADAPDRVWVADFSYVSTWSGWAYVVFVFDAYSRAIVGWTASGSTTTALVSKALNMAVWRRHRHGHPIEPRLIHHSDAGSRYTSTRAPTTLGNHHADRRGSETEAGPEPVTVQASAVPPRTHRPVVPCLPRKRSCRVSDLSRRVPPGGQRAKGSDAYAQDHRDPLDSPDPHIRRSRNSRSDPCCCDHTDSPRNPRRRRPQ
ncbi:DDE-type integrase/transposase/recombinase [Nocardia abscessus]|nr:DDE-type integrase/transposase/recombinase [Nocardia abscessus]